MQRSDVMQQLKEYISTQILDGQDIGLGENTPLLEWGIINSIELVRLMSFIQKHLHVVIPTDKILAENFTSLSAITDMVQENSTEQITG